MNRTMEFVHTIGGLEYVHPWLPNSATTLMVLGYPPTSFWPTIMMSRKYSIERSWTYTSPSIDLFYGRVPSADGFPGMIVFVYTSLMSV